MSTLRSRAIRASFALLLSAPAAPPADARKFVASYGSDANPCTITAPCRSFQRVEGDEVFVLDSAGYGPVTAGFISIVAPDGIYAGITVQPPALVGVTVAPGGYVSLKNVVINGLGGNVGILVQQDSKVYISDCTISNFASAGISSTGPGSTISVKDSVIRNNSAPGAYGIWLNAAGATANLDRTRVESNFLDGIRIEGGAAASIKRSVISNNGGTGIAVNALGAQKSSVTVDDSLVSDNLGDGITTLASAAGAVAIVAVSRNTITRNLYGVSGNGNAPGTSTLNLAENLIAQNAVDGVFANGSGVTILASNNMFAGNVAHALNTAAGGTIHTAKGADGLPNNSGEQATPTAGTVTPFTPF